MGQTAHAALVPHGETSEAARLSIHSITVITSTFSALHNHATIQATLGLGQPETFVGQGVGPIDAMCKALDRYAPGFEVTEWTARSAGRGSDAVARADVSIRTPDGGNYHGRASHRNTMQATAEAIADALNKHLFVRWRGTHGRGGANGVQPA